MKMEQKFNRRGHSTPKEVSVCYARWACRAQSCETACKPPPEVFNHKPAPIRRGHSTPKEVSVCYARWACRAQSCETACKPPPEVFNHKPAPVPDRHCSCAVVPLWYHTFEVCVFEWVIFCLDREPFYSMFGWRCFWEHDWEMFKLRKMNDIHNDCNCT
jgi:hypothetical protein